KKLGFTNVRLAGEEVGRASMVKMVRSVMIKGLEALSAECVGAAWRAGVLDDVIASLDASWPGADWASRANYSLDRMMVHGLRRAAEMREVVKTLESLGQSAEMSRATTIQQQSLGERAQKDLPESLPAKLRLIHGPARGEFA